MSDNITKPVDVRPNNVFGTDPTTQQGSCDFAGDGQQDAFVATGVTWWARSPMTGQRRYMNTVPEPLSRLELVDLNQDGKCDVTGRPIRPELPPIMWSRNGTGPWERVLGVLPPSDRSAFQDIGIGTRIAWIAWMLVSKNLKREGRV